MNRLSITAFIAILLAFGSCSSKKSLSYNIVVETNAKKVNPTDTLHFSLNTEVDIKNYEFYWNNEKLAQPYVIPQYTGEQQVKAIIETESGLKEITKNIRVFASTKPKICSNNFCRNIALYYVTNGFVVRNNVVLSCNSLFCHQRWVGCYTV